MVAQQINIGEEWFSGIAGIIMRSKLQVCFPEKQPLEELVPSSSH